MLGLLWLSVALCVMWIAVELRSEVPLIVMSMMRRRTVAAAYVSSFLLGVGMFAAFGGLPQFLQMPASSGYGFGASITGSGLVLAPISVGMFVLGLCAGRLTARFGARALLAGGAGVAAIGYFAFAVAHGTVASVLVATTIVGVGLGLAFSAVAIVVIEAIPHSQTGVASGMNINIRAIGGSVGSAAMASIVSAGVPPAVCRRSVGTCRGS